MTRCLKPENIPKMGKLETIDCTGCEHLDKCKNAESRGFYACSEFKEKEIKSIKVNKGIKEFGRVLDTSPTYWGCAIAGEVGELANILKKMERDYEVKVLNPEVLGSISSHIYLTIKDELADILIYAELIARRCGINLDEAVSDKVKKIDKRRKD